MDRARRRSRRHRARRRFNRTASLAYEGDDNFTTSTSPMITVAVGQDTTTATVSPLDPAVYGDTVTIMVTVTANSPGSGVPTGTVKFYDHGTLLGCEPLDGSGVATLPVSDLGVGTHCITAVYKGDTDFVCSRATAVSFDVTQQATTTTLSPSTGPAVYGQSVMLTATVAGVSGGADLPTGTVTFYDGATELGTWDAERIGSGDNMHDRASGWLRHDHGDLQWGHELRGQRRDVDHAEGNSGVVNPKRSQLIRIRVGVRRVGDVHGDCNRDGSRLWDAHGNGRVLRRRDIARDRDAGWIGGCDVLDGGLLGWARTPSRPCMRGMTTSRRAPWTRRRRRWTRRPRGPSWRARTCARVWRSDHVDGDGDGEFARAGMPTWTVDFYDGDTLIGTGTLDESGEATFTTTSALDYGTHDHGGVRRGRRFQHQHVDRDQRRGRARHHDGDRVAAGPGGVWRHGDADGDGHGG